MIPELDTPERVHYAMLQGVLPRITMMQCAHTWGEQAVTELNHTNALRAEMRNIARVLEEYEGASVHEQVLGALDEVEWLKDQLMAAQQRDHATTMSAADTEADLREALRKLRLARECMEANDPLNARDIFGPPKGDDHEQDARQASGPSSPEQKCQDG